MRIVLAVVISLMFAPTAASASSNVPSKDFVLDNAETVLSGVDVSGDSIDRLTGRFGKPTQATDRPDTLYQYGRRDHEWDLGTIRLRVTTVRRLGGTFFADDTVETVEVWGAKAFGEIRTAGRGLQLGATVADAGRIYGSRSGHEPRPSKIKTLAVAKPITGRVNHIKLTKLDPWADF